MSAIGDTLLLSKLSTVATEPLPTVAQLGLLSSFACSCVESDAAIALGSLIGLLTGWQAPLQGQGVAIGRPTLAPTYQLLFTRAP